MFDFYFELLVRVSTMICIFNKDWCVLNMPKDVLCISNDVLEFYKIKMDVWNFSWKIQNLSSIFNFDLNVLKIVLVGWMVGNLVSKMDKCNRISFEN